MRLLVRAVGVARMVGRRTLSSVSVGVQNGPLNLSDAEEPADE
jgi:hypothetical protein